MSRLIVISNRVTAGASASGSQGGLWVAIAAALRQYRGIWFGWSGGITDHFSRPDRPSAPRRGDHGDDRPRGAGRRRIL
jgi:trehalose-6-phosphate synthase